MAPLPFALSVGSLLCLIYLLQHLWAHLDHRAADNDDGKPKPGGNRDRLLEEEAPGEDADHGKDRNINPEEPGKVPLHRIDHHTVAAEHDEAGNDEPEHAAVQPLSDHRVPTHLE